MYENDGIKILLNKIFINEWVIGIGTAVVAGLILFFFFGIGRQRKRKVIPYVQISKVLFFNKDNQWIRFHYSIANLGNDIAREVKTYTQIAIQNNVEFQSPISATSIIPPGQVLQVRSEDPLILVELCQIPKKENEYVFIVEYLDSKGNKYRVSKSFFYHPQQNLLSTRKENPPSRSVDKKVKMVFM